MNIEKRSAKTWRARMQIHGATVCQNFDHRPSMREAYAALYEKAATIAPITTKDSFETCAKKYVASRSNIVSPSTLGEYTLKIGRLSDKFTALPIHKVRQQEIQAEINEMSSRLSLKTVKDMRAFILAVCKAFQDDFRPYTITLPMERKKAVYAPSDDDIRQIINAAKGTQYEIAVQLGAFGLRRSEICAITAEDLDGNVLHINKAYVQNKASREWFIKSTKTTESERDVFIPTELADAIRAAGRAYDGYPNCISNFMRRTQDKLGMPHFSLHKERHYFCTLLSDMGVPEADILKMGGWSTDHVMKKIYRHDRYGDKQQALSDKISEKLTS